MTGLPEQSTVFSNYCGVAIMSLCNVLFILVKIFLQAKIPSSRMPCLMVGSHVLNVFCLFIQKIQFSESSLFTLLHSIFACATKALLLKLEKTGAIELGFVF